MENARRNFMKQGAVLLPFCLAPPKEAEAGIPILSFLFSPFARRSVQKAIGSMLGQAVHTATAAATRGGGLKILGVAGGVSAAIWAYLGIREVANLHPEAWERVKAMLPSFEADRQTSSFIQSHLAMASPPSGAEPRAIHGGVTAIRPEALFGSQPLDASNSIALGVQGLAMPGMPVQIAVPMSLADLSPGEWLLSGSLYDVARQEYYEAEAESRQLQRLVVR